ncbi:LOW QUALITY PROTEIN: phagosome assembly factor 1-like [Dermacentor silvarum]|uniref:LOW QUALITY PROTEIN: phagosome assembly factor 1-like n=1 Tax=Dermacentor silvarum TaxID=543639 RepID=UPI002100EB3B|nr:LOW QUALITY PROTEIN: phagosome assembly factor 1-like [Dermacentor silvarum]
MLELDVVPEKSLGNEGWELVLGMAFSQVVHILQQQFRIIKGVQIIYNEQCPLDSDLVILLSEDGIRLSFDSSSQRLKVIEVTDMSKVKLTYCGSTFCSPEVLPTRQQIDDCFGATHPGEFDASQQMFVLHFRGLSFSFLADPKCKLDAALGSSPTGQVPNGSSPLVSRMAIYYGNSLTDTRPPPLPLCCFGNQSFLEALEVLREGDTTLGVRLTLLTEAYETSRLSGPIQKKLTRCVYFGDSVQDVVWALGSPNKVFYKEEDKMKIHAQDSHRLLAARASDYFYNYFTLGMDVLFDAQRHVVKKIVLQSNYPGHFNFQQYYRCPFRLRLRLPPTPEQRRATLVDVADEDEGHAVTAFTKWDELQERLVKASERPVVLNRTSSTNTTNPFGSTYCYGYQDIIFEVMRNKHIASVTLYQRSGRLHRAKGTAS